MIAEISPESAGDKPKSPPRIASAITSAAADPSESAAIFPGTLLVGESERETETDREGKERKAERKNKKGV